MSNISATFTNIVNSENITLKGDNEIITNFITINIEDIIDNEAIGINNDLISVITNLPNVFKTLVDIEEKALDISRQQQDIINNVVPPTFNNIVLFNSSNTNSQNISFKLGGIDNSNLQVTHSDTTRMKITNYFNNDTINGCYNKTTTTTSDICNNGFTVSETGIYTVFLNIAISSQFTNHLLDIIVDTSDNLEQPYILNSVILNENYKHINILQPCELKINDIINIYLNINGIEPVSINFKLSNWGLYKNN
tara:strand:- start:3936 stop:4691 length:756 start_codon:yes stop_codon:yes gene_type:complete